MENLNFALRKPSFKFHSLKYFWTVIHWVTGIKLAKHKQPNPMMVTWGICGYLLSKNICSQDNILSITSIKRTVWNWSVKIACNEQCKETYFSSPLINKTRQNSFFFFMTKSDSFVKNAHFFTLCSICSNQGSISFRVVSSSHWFKTAICCFGVYKHMHIHKQ